MPSLESEMHTEADEIPPAPVGRESQLEQADYGRPGIIQADLMREIAATTPVENLIDDALPETDNANPASNPGKTAVRGTVAMGEKSAVGEVAPPPQRQLPENSDIDKESGSMPDTGSGDGAGKPPSEKDILAYDEGDDRPEAQDGATIPSPAALQAADAASWEQALRQEGMPEELPTNIAFTLALAERYERAAEALRGEQTTEPTNAQIADYLAANGAPHTHVNAVRHWGSQVNLSAVEALPDQETAHDEVILVQRAVANALSHLTAREAAVLKARFGMGFDLPLDGEDTAARELVAESYTRRLSLRELRQLMGLRIEKIREIEARARGNLRRQDATETGRLM